MALYPFKTDELQLKMLPPPPGIYGMPGMPQPQFNTPITPRENWELVVRREKPLWIPNISTDFNLIQPDVMPDATARAKGGLDWFGIDWEYEPLSRAAMVRPGTRRLSDITEWENEIVWPDFGDIDWQRDYDERYKNLNPDRPTMFVIVNGFFERLADLTSFEDAMVSFLTDPEAVTAFYTRLCDWHIQLIKIAREVYKADIITFHDDMGTQRSSFLSPALFKEILMPHYQRMNRAAHDMGLTMVFHSCGSVSNQIENFIESGFDFWEGQDACNDKFAIKKATGDRLGQCGMFMSAPGTPVDEVKAGILKRITELGYDGRFITMMMAMEVDGFNPAAFLYEQSRRFFLGEQI